MRWIIRIYLIVLMAYTGWRTYDFLTSQLPKNDVSTWLSIIFLFAAEIGLFLWHEISMSHTTTKEQYNIAIAMIFTDFIGSLAAGVADMIIRQTMIDGYTIPTFLATGLMYGLPAVMAANVAAALYYLSNDAKLQQERAEREMEFEIYSQALKEVSKDKKVIAAEKKAMVAARIRKSVEKRVDSTNTLTPAVSASVNGQPAGRGKKYVIHVDPEKAAEVQQFLGDKDIELVPRYGYHKNGGKR